MTPVDCYKNIPQELKSQTAWINVYNWSKCPWQTTERETASSTNPSTWGSFEDAVENVQDGSYDGIGFVFHDTGIIGIDIDIGFDEDGLPSETAIDILCRCKSYTEKSRSGRGFHVLLHGDLPFKGRNNRNGVEIYKSDRYFIMTGKQVVFDEIAENQEAIDYIVSAYFPDIIKEGDNYLSPRIYSPEYRRPEGKRIFVKPEYPLIMQGGRNLSLTSLAGQLHTQGYTKALIYRELLYANSVACRPPLDEREIQSICNSITKYRRKRDETS